MRGYTFQSLDVIAAAMRIRKLSGLGSGDAVCAPDIASNLKIEVRFVALPSLEGMYAAGDTPAIFLSTNRPAGRRNFTCAHELGHHILGHGSVLDEIWEEARGAKKDPKEVSADLFAAHLLMPRGLLLRALNSLADARHPSPIEIYELSSWLGVGYTTLLSHLAYGLRILNLAVYDELRRVTPKAIRAQVLGKTASRHLIMVTQRWTGRPIDCEIGDHIALPEDFVMDDPSMEDVGASNGLRFYIAMKSGIVRVSSVTTGLENIVRTSQFEYVGRNCFRFEQEIS